jgi:hypothetical protein
MQKFDEPVGSKCIDETRAYILTQGSDLFAVQTLDTVYRLSSMSALF